MKKLLLLIHLLIWLVGAAWAQCPLGDPEPNCNLLVPNAQPGVVAFTDNMTIGIGTTAVYTTPSGPPPRNPVNFTLNGGTLVVCSGTLRVGDINFGQNGGKIIVASGAVLNINNTNNNPPPLNINATNRVVISVYGDFFSNREIRIQGGANAGHTIFIDEIGFASFTAGLAMLSTSAAVINNGIMILNGDGLAINNGTVCLGQDAILNTNSLSNTTSNPVLIPGGVGSACVGVGGNSISSNQSLTLSPNLIICLSVPTLPPGVNFGAATVNFNCTGCLELLPIQLLSFRGFSRGVANVLKWVVAPGSTFETVTVERSADGRNFQPAGPALLPHAEFDELVYQFTDFNPHPRLNYYRLKVLDTDGTIDYSRVLTLAGISETAGLTLYPNPVEGAELTYALGRVSAGNLTIEIISMTGQIVFRDAYAVEEGSLSATLNLSMLPAGMYWFRAQTRQQHFHKKFVINR